ncbi:hypothetical protein AB0E69_24715 [Kribbella sp. NPDC026611]|uniref:hypothetical protein n=1 Tax=Kribbella sp. NPDC026611 TaxID=3154911 RepID=UPI0033CC5448
MLRTVGLKLLRFSPWHRGYGEGFDGGIGEAAAFVDVLLATSPEATIPRTDVEDLRTRIKRESSTH